jgi:hypothetical protein
VVLPKVDLPDPNFQEMLSLVYRDGQYYYFHAKGLADEAMKNHADRVWKIVKYENFLTSKANNYQVY